MWVLYIILTRALNLASHVKYVFKIYPHAKMCIHINININGVVYLVWKIGGFLLNVL